MVLESFEISLIIRGKDININEDIFSERFKKREYCRGEVISKVIPPLEEDVYIVTYKLNNDYEDGMCEFLKTINEIDCNSLIEKGNELKIRLYIQTFEGQLKIDIPHKIIELLNEIKLDFEISVLSWGEVEENEIKY